LSKHSQVLRVTDIPRSINLWNSFATFASFFQQPEAKIYETRKTACHPLKTTQAHPCISFKKKGVQYI